MSKKCRLTSILATAALTAVCMVGGALFTVDANAEETWTKLNDNTTITDGVIKAGNTAANNDYVAKYNQTINLEEGFKVDFTVDGYQGASNDAWNQFQSHNNIAFALTAGEASTTGQMAYVFGYGAKDNGELRLYTHYTKDFKLQGGKVSFTEDGNGVTGYFDNTTRDGSFDTTVQWNTLTEFSLAGDIVNGIPMFWMNGHVVNPFGGSVYSTSGAANILAKLRGCYAGFRMETSALHLYAFNTSGADQAGEFAVNVTSVSDYQAAKAGWVAADAVTAETSANGVTFSGFRGIKEGNSMSRTRFIYDHIFDLDTDTIEFQYSMPNNALSGAVTWISVRGVGMDQFTSAKYVAPTHYEDFLWNGGITMGVYGNSANAEAFGFSANGVTGTGPDVKDETWTTKTVWFGLTAPNNYSYKINGKTISNYSRDQLISVLGDDLKAEIVLIPSDDAARLGTQYKLRDFVGWQTFENSLLDAVKMTSGASVRYGGDMNVSGLRFRMVAAKADYAAITSKLPAGVNSADVKVQYGILVIRQDYYVIHANFTVENLFGANARYYLAEKGGSTEDRTNAKGENQKAIINFWTDDLNLNETTQEYEYYGSITNIKPQNLGNSFIGVGVIKYTVGSKTQYLLTGYTGGEDMYSNRRSIVEVAQSAIADPELNAEARAWLQENYIDRYNNLSEGGEA